MSSLPKAGTPIVLAGASLGELPTALDRCFLSMDLERERGRGLARYAGTIDGRRVRVGCALRTRRQFVGYDNISFTRFAGVAIEIVVETPVSTRLVVSPPLHAAVDNLVVQGVEAAFRAVASRRFGLERVDRQRLPDATMHVLASEPAWAADYMADGRVRQVLDRIGGRQLPDAAPWKTYSLRFGPGGSSGPGSVSLTINVADTIDPAAAAGWIDSALELTRIAEDRPPRVEVEPTPSELEARRNPERAAMRTALLLVLGLPLLLLAAVAITMGLGFLLLGEGVQWLPIAFMAVVMPYAMFLVFRLWARRSRG